MSRTKEQREGNEVVPLNLIQSMMLRPQISLFECSFEVCDLVLQIENQNTFSGYVYDNLSAKGDIFHEPPALSRREFVRIWKSCLLIRAQDLYLRLKRTAPPDERCLVTPRLVPAPLAHLLKALGRSRCPQTGFVVEVVPPPLDGDDLPAWAVHDEAVLTRWNRFMCAVYEYFVGYLPFASGTGTMAAEFFPHIDDFDDKSIGLTAVKSVGEMRHLRSVSSMPTRGVSLIRICNDELFCEPVRPFHQMLFHLDACHDVALLRQRYFNGIYDL